MSYSSYNDLFDKTYKKAINEGTKYAKNLLISHKKKHKNATKSINNVSYKLRDYKDDLYINEKKFKPIINLYKTRSEYYEIEFMYLIIPNEIFDTFKQIKSIKEKYGFKELIVELAYYMAYGDLNRIFRNNHSLYDLMYYLDDFKDFHIRKDPYLMLESTELYKNLLERRYPPKKKDKTEKKKPNKNISNFQLKDGSQKILKSYINIWLIKN